MSPERLKISPEQQEQGLPQSIEQALDFDPAKSFPWRELGLVDNFLFLG